MVIARIAQQLIARFHHNSHSARLRCPYHGDLRLYSAFPAPDMQQRQGFLRGFHSREAKDSIKAIGTAAVACVAMDREHEIGVSAAEFMVTLGDGCASPALRDSTTRKRPSSSRRVCSAATVCSVSATSCITPLRRHPPRHALHPAQRYRLAEIIIDQKADIANQKQHHCETQLAQSPPFLLLRRRRFGGSYSLQFFPFIAFPSSA